MDLTGDNEVGMKEKLKLVVSSKLKLPLLNTSEYFIKQLNKRICVSGYDRDALNFTFTGYY